MATGRLKLGFSACYFHADPERKIFKGKTLLYLEQSIAHWALAQGAIVYMLPSIPKNSPVTTEELIADLDGLVLQGGSDVSPKNYGEEPLRPEWAGDYVRDQHEIELVRAFRAAGKPVFGICRGAQLVNVAFGGSLYQDIATQLPKARDHRNWEIYDRNWHDVQFAQGSELAKLYPGRSGGTVNTVHHQAIKTLGAGLVVEATCSEDGVIEAIRTPDSMVYAVQWHPEFMDPPAGLEDPRLLSCRPLLDSFLKRCASKRS